MAIVAVLIIIYLACSASSESRKAEVVRIVAEDRIATLIKVIAFLEAHENAGKLAVSPEYLAMKKVIAEAEQEVGKHFTEE